MIPISIYIVDEERRAFCDPCAEAERKEGLHQDMTGPVEATDQTCEGRWRGDGFYCDSAGEYVQTFLPDGEQPGDPQFRIRRSVEPLAGGYIYYTMLDGERDTKWRLVRESWGQYATRVDIDATIEVGQDDLPTELWIELLAFYPEWNPALNVIFRERGSGGLNGKLLGADFWPACRNCAHFAECNAGPARHAAFPHIWHWGRESEHFPEGLLIIRSWVGSSVIGESHTGCADYVIEPAQLLQQSGKHAEYLRNARLLKMMDSELKRAERIELLDDRVKRLYERNEALFARQIALTASALAA